MFIYYKKFALSQYLHEEKKANFNKNRDNEYQQIHINNQPRLAWRGSIRLCIPCT
jgi:hypothetical protein